MTATSIVWTGERGQRGKRIDGGVLTHARDRLQAGCLSGVDAPLDVCDAVQRHICVDYLKLKLEVDLVWYRPSVDFSIDFGFVLVRLLLLSVYV